LNWVYKILEIVKTKNNQLKNVIPDFTIKRDVLGLINPKKTNDNKTIKSNLNEAIPELKVKYASLMFRFITFFLDIIIVFTFLTILNKISKIYLPSYDGINIIGILFSGIIWLLYCGFFESSKWQATIGKLIIGLKVIDIHGNRLVLSKALIRCLALFVAILPLGYGIWGVSNDPHKQGWHDMMSDSFVIKL
jgi:uncharacterized RDD family membrane protein YckC